MKNMKHNNTSTPSGGSSPIDEVPTYFIEERGGNPLESESFESQTDQGLKKKEPEKNRILLLKLTQKKELPFSILNTIENTTEIKGEFSAIKWNYTESIAGMISSTLSELNLLNLNQIKIETSIEIFNGISNPIVELSISEDVANSKTRDEIKEIHEIIQIQLNSTINPDSISKSLLGTELPYEKIQKIQSVTKKFLLSNGGGIVHAPIIATNENGIIGKIKGKFPPKPNQSNYNSIKVYLLGVIDGFIKSEEYIIFNEKNTNGMKINSGRILTKFKDISEYIDNTTIVKIEADMIIEKNGKPIYNLVKIVEPNTPEKFHLE